LEKKGGGGVEEMPLSRIMKEREVVRGGGGEGKDLLQKKKGGIDLIYEKKGK